jgi:hypothetical protein
MEWDGKIPTEGEGAGKVDEQILRSAALAQGDPLLR